MPGVSTAGFKSSTKRIAGGNIHLMRLALSIFAWLFILGTVWILLVALVGCPSSGSKLQRVWADFNAIGSRLEDYRKDNGNFPSTEEGLTALIECPSSHPAPERWKQRLTKVPKDPWMNDYRYRLHGSGNTARVEIWSPGKDGKTGTKDDISSLDEER